MSDRVTWGKELVAGLEDLVMNVLREVAQNKEILGPTEICQRAGIYLDQATSQSEDWVGVGILRSLEGKGLVSHPGRGQWIIPPDRCKNG